jgi:hypothetical protein
VREVKGPPDDGGGLFFCAGVEVWGGSEGH